MDSTASIKVQDVYEIIGAGDAARFDGPLGRAIMVTSFPVFYLRKCYEASLKIDI